MVFKVVLEPSDEGGYTAIVPALPGCISEGDSIEDTLVNIREAVELYLEPISDLPYAEGQIIQEIAV
jgi:predicted RNase H-like HicB family nuclease